jgi:hypothetical protein
MIKNFFWAVIFLGACFSTATKNKNCEPGNLAFFHHCQKRWNLRIKDALSVQEKLNLMYICAQ